MDLLEPWKYFKEGRVNVEKQGEQSHVQLSLSLT